MAGLSTPARTAAVAALAALWLAMMIGGTGAIDQHWLHALYAANRPGPRAAAMAATVFGEWQTVLLLSAVAVAWLLFRRRRHAALLLLGITVSGRVLVEAQKFGVHRLRPNDEAHLVAVRTLSFPSAHAANSMLLFLALAVVAAPPKWRWWAVPAALAGSFAVGISRPMLGVHWPSDVIGGWAFGAAWVLAMAGLAERGAPLHENSVRR